MSHNLPTLVQRVSFRKEPSEHQKGIDRLFSFDYMGSSEFEFGALGAALRCMRAEEPKKWKVEQITSGQHVVFYVGTKECAKVAHELFTDQLRGRDQRARTKEMTRIHETYIPPDPKDKFAIRDKFDGWWAIDGRPTPFALFKDKVHAEAFLGAL